MQPQPFTSTPYGVPPPYGGTPQYPPSQATIDSLHHRVAALEVQLQSSYRERALAIDQAVQATLAHVRQHGIQVSHIDIGQWQVKPEQAGDQYLCFRQMQKQTKDRRIAFNADAYANL